MQKIGTVIASGRAARAMALFSPFLLALASLSGSRAQTPDAAAARLPPGPGRDSVVQTCSGCHSLGMVTGKRRSADEWSAVIQEMIGHGAHIDADHATIIRNYLTAHFSVAAATGAPPVAASNCTAPTSFSYQGTITATAPGPVSYRWLYSSGQQGPVQTVDFAAAGHRQVTGSTVQAMTAGTGWAEVQMLSPAQVTSNKASYQLLCGRAAEIGAAGAVQPASQTAACGAPAPRFTATGFITSRKAQTVTYHWALSDGRSTPPASRAE